ncbi:hypothetical protein [Moraxella equi]|uniref:hypothetical protein n=1 Tax=Moraxella equi TaxID=60442 RepID=UPI00117D610F|nr:hypothetical protein [Moraxella equi]
MKSYAKTDAHQHQSPTSHTLHQFHTPHPPPEVIHIDRLTAYGLKKVKRTPYRTFTFLKVRWRSFRRLLWITSHCTNSKNPTASPLSTPAESTICGGGFRRQICRFLAK